MIELLMAILGGNHCGWCNRKQYNWFERTFGGYASQPTWRTVVFKSTMWLADHPPVWKLAFRWHQRFHLEEEE